MNIHPKSTLVLTAIYLGIAGASAASQDFGAIRGHINNFSDKPVLGKLYQSRTENSGSGKSKCLKYWPYAAVIAIGGGIFAFDEDLNDFSQRGSLHNHGLDNFSKNLGRLGPAGPYIITVPLFAGYGLIAEHNYSLMTAIDLTAGFAAAEFVTGGAKIVAGRERPSSTEDPYEFFKGGHSFWSGHTISAFTFATIMTKRYPRQNLGFIGINHEFPFIPVLTYSFATIAGLQRLYANAHWASDVYFAALAGYAVGSLNVHFSNKLQTGKLTFRPGQTYYIVYNISLDGK
jgi:membrane-associated phospholipid phosphatase